MPRIRSIKYSLYENETLAELPIHTRFAFPALWTLADREGRLEDRPKKLQKQIFGYDSDLDIEVTLSDLESHGFVTRYSTDSGNYIAINNWRKHQNPNPREAVLCPEPPAITPKTRAGQRKVTDKSVTSHSQNTDSSNLVEQKKASSIPHYPVLGGVGGSDSVTQSLAILSRIERMPSDQQSVIRALVNSCTRRVSEAGLNLIVSTAAQYPAVDLLAVMDEHVDFQQRCGKAITARTFQDAVRRVATWPKYQLKTNGHVPAVEVRPINPFTGQPAADDEVAMNKARNPKTGQYHYYADAKRMVAEQP